MKSSLNKTWNRIRFAVFVTLLTTALLYLRYGRQDLREHWALIGNDLMQKAAPTVPASDVVIVEITEKDAAEKGQWPWPRAEMAHLVNRLRDAGAGVIVFADVFNAPDLAKTDSAFVDSIRDNGVVLARSVDQTVVNPVETIAAAAAAVGYNNTVPDADGVVRRMDLVTVNDDRVYYSLGIEAMRTLIGSAKVKVQQQDRAQAINLNDLQPWIVPNNSRWRIKFNREFQKINSLNKDLSIVKNRVVIIGVSTQQVNNWIHTSVGPMRNHEVQAHFVQSLFDRNNVVTPPWADMLEMLVSVLILTSILKAAKANTPYACIPVYVGGTAVVIMGSWMLFTTANLAVDWTWPFLSSSSVFALTFYYHWAINRRNEWIVSKRFGDIVNNTVLKKLKKNHQQICTTGELKEISVLYADLRDFAKLAAEYGNNAEGLVKLVHSYMDSVLPVITQNNGTVDKLIGDGIVAFWNAPLDVENHAIVAVKSAISMQREISKFNQILTPEETPLCLDIGINTGMAVVGNTGSKKTFNYTAIGDAVRTADGLENLCKHYGVNIMLGEHTVKQIQDNTLHINVPDEQMRLQLQPGFATLELDTVFMESGVAMRVFTIDNPDDPLTEAHRKLHDRMLESYYAGKYDAAIRMCKELKADYKLVEYYNVMINKCKTAKISLEEDTTPTA